MKSWQYKNIIHTSSNKDKTLFTIVVLVFLALKRIIPKNIALFQIFTCTLYISFYLTEEPLAYRHPIYEDFCTFLRYGNLHASCRGKYSDKMLSFS